jgi:hypothetical protein
MMTATLLCLLSLIGTSTEEAIDEALASLCDHPRLLVNAAEIEMLKASVAEHPDKAKILEIVIREADTVFEKAPSERIQKGKRLLSVSREVLRRILYLGTAFHFTDNERYVKRAVEEMLAVAKFSDWNPSHFLDVAEMTTAFALGYDWFFHVLSEEEKVIIRRAILDLGIAPSFAGHDSWARRDNNWNQVCNGGMLFGALALADEETELAKRVILRTIDGLPYAMRTYQPDGIYVEGPSYWEYGTTYNVLCIAALESALGTSFGLADFPGFKETGAFPLYMTGPTGDHFTFSDCGSKHQLFPAVYWFARRWEDPGLAWPEELWLQRLLSGERVSTGRFLPLALYWWSGEKPQVPQKPLTWYGEGQNPIAILRTSWDNSDATWLAFKGGTPWANHGHMDIGSFVLEADGVRWAVDVMGKGYGELEAMDLGIWNRKQESDRWKIFAYHNNSHNTLVVDGKGQLVQAEAPILHFSDDPDFSFAIIDMSAVYADELVQAQRGVALRPDGSVLIQDELTNNGQESSVRWAMSTPATLEVEAAAKGWLRHQEKTLHMTVDASLDGDLQTLPEYEWLEWDRPMTHLSQVGFFMKLAPDEKQTCRVLFQPGGEKTRDMPPSQPLSQWGNK